MKMPGSEFSKANFLASPRDLPSGARVFLTVKAELATEVRRGDSTSDPWNVH
jgi:hypothetical protein